jgi:hypothetical protein
LIIGADKSFKPNKRNGNKNHSNVASFLRDNWCNSGIHEENVFAVEMSQSILIQILRISE